MTPFMKKIESERTLLMLPINVVVIGRVEGYVEPGRVSEALEKLRTRHRQLAVRVEFDEDGTGWYRSEDVPPVPVAVEARETEGAWLNRLRTEYRTPFSIEKGPLVRCALIRSETHCDVLLTGHHAICDGKSLIYLLRDLLEAVTSPDAPIEALPDPPPIDDTTVPAPRRTNPVMRWFLKAVNNKWSSKKLRFTESDMFRMHEAFWQRNEDVRILTWELEEDLTASLVARCREENVTVNSALWTAFLAAQEAAQNDGKPYRLRSALAVNTRDKLNVKVGETLGFYASSLEVEMPLLKDKPFWDAARMVHRAIEKRLKRTDLFRALVATRIHPTLLDSLYFQKYGFVDQKLASRFLKKMKWDQVNFGCALTNVGRLDIPTEYGPLKVRSVYGPSLYSDVDEKFVGAATVGGKLSIILSCNGDLVSIVTCKKLKEAVADSLRDATEEGTTEKSALRKEEKIAAF